MTPDQTDALMESLAEALVLFDGRIVAIAKPLSDDDLDAIAQRCRREAHPQPGDAHNFEVPVWDFVADMLEREVKFRRAVAALLNEEALAGNSR